jgi:hypothetical protein
LGKVRNQEKGIAVPHVTLTDWLSSDLTAEPAV